MTDLYLFARIAGTPVAIRTGDIEAVVKLPEIAPIPLMPLHVAGLSTLRSRVLTVIDVAALITGHPAERSADPLAIIVDLASHSYAMIVDTVSDILAVPSGELPLRGRLDPAWAPYARAIVEDGEGPALLVDPASFIEASPTPLLAV